MDTKAPSPSGFAAPALFPGGGEGLAEEAFPAPPQLTTGGDKKARASVADRLLPDLSSNVNVTCAGHLYPIRASRNANPEIPSLRISTMVSTVSLSHGER